MLLFGMPSAGLARRGSGSVILRVVCSLCVTLCVCNVGVLWLIPRDQPNSRFHGRDIFREIGLLPKKRLFP